MFLQYGEEQKMHEAQVLIGILGASMAGKKVEPQKRLIVSSAAEAPDRAAFYASPELRKHIKRGPG